VLIWLAALERFAGGALLQTKLNQKAIAPVEAQSIRSPQLYRATAPVDRRPSTLSAGII